jgi:hypothetical protein
MNLFYTKQGYRGGHILSQNEVLFTKDEYGNTINEKEYITSESYVIPIRKNRNTLWINKRINNPLTIHNKHHHNSLNLINEHLSNKDLEKAHWLVNVVLFIDDYKHIPKDVFLEALTNYQLDCTAGIAVREPIYYVFDILNIDGIYFKKESSLK